MSLLYSFNQHCHTTPDQPALIEGDRQISYQQLQQKIRPLSNHLKQNKCQRIILALDRGIDAATALLAVLNSGGCYVPLDLKNPAHRLNFIINDADPQCIIGKGTGPDWLKKKTIWLDMDQIPELSWTDGFVDINRETLAAILYTSGSTGTPKGVALSYRAIANFTNWAAATFSVSSQDTIASLAPFHFDLSLFDLISSLNSGATVHFIPNMLTLSPTRLTTWLQHKRITIWYTVPSILGFIALKGGLEETPLPDLKTLLFAGEVFSTPQLIKLCQLLPHVAFFNLYGPTETNVCCYWPVQRNRLHENQTIPIGNPACRAVLSIDKETDELLVESDNNLSGYWQHGRLIAAIKADNKYHTGDKVTRNRYGEYCYHGRLDRMLKCSGYRVEPAEIEQAIQHCAGVVNCAVVGIKDSTSGQRPAAVVVLKTGYELSNIVKPLKQSLPIYMHPCKIKVLQTLPYLNNGKTDYQSIQQLLENA